jgi:hypothetical protein
VAHFSLLIPRDNRRGPHGTKRGPCIRSHFPLAAAQLILLHLFKSDEDEQADEVVEPVAEAEPGEGLEEGEAYVKHVRAG